MKKKSLKILSTVLATSMVFSLAGCGGNGDKTPDPTPTTAPSTGDNNPTTPEPTKGGTEDPAPTSAGEDTTPTDAPSTPDNTPKEIVTIRFGTHYEQELNPHWQDEVTQEYAMETAQREARYAAEEAILNELGVKFEYVQYAGNTTEVLLQSVMANDPVCDIAWMWGGSEGVVLSQNVLQKLDDYVAPFTEDPEMSWMLYDQCFGHYYFLGANMRFTQRWPLVYNISYIEEVDSLKDENGNTIYPNDLYMEGKWTWSTFKDYLAKIEAHYANSTAPSGRDRRIDAYQTDYRFAALSAAYSNGGGLYNGNGLVMNSEETKKAIAYIKELMDANLLVCETWNGLYQPGEPGWTWNGSNFQSGETVFTDIPDWYIGGAASKAAERKESIGIVPWPRPDERDINDPAYQQVMTASDSIGILKGVSPEKTELAMKALALFYKTYYCKLAGVNSIDEYRSSYAIQQAAKDGFDVFHDEVGDSMQATYSETVSKLKGNDFSDLFGLRGDWDQLLVKSLYGLEGYASYEISIESHLNEFETKITDIGSALSSDAIRDNIAPSVNLVSDDVIAIAAGTTFESISWGDYISANDGVDGALDISGMEVTWNTEVDFNVAGTYNDAFNAKFSDKSGNSGSRNISFVIYNPGNTTPPTLTTIAEPAAIAVDTNANEIGWVGTFIESAVDADGLDLSKRVKADLSGIDTTTPGTYTVTITVTDYAGNEASVDVEATVE